MTEIKKRDPIRRVLDNLDKFRLWTDEDREASLTQSLSELDEITDIWVFGYGSLVWHPEFDFEEERKATLEGYHRSLCLWSTVNRGNREQPGLVFGLAEGGKCEGKVFRLSNENIMEQLRVLWRRELPSSSYTPKWLTLETEQGPVQALVFVMDPTDHSYADDLTQEETIDVVLKAHGNRGPCVDYVLQTDEALKMVGIEDHSLADLSDKLKARLK